MSEPNAHPPRTPAELQAALSKRLRWAVIGSVIVNAVGWSVALAVIKHRDAVHQQYVTMTRIENKKLAAIKSKKVPIKKAAVKKQAIKPPAAPKQKAQKPSAPAPPTPKFITAKPTAGGVTTPDTFVAPPDGTGKAGKVFDPNKNGKGDGNGGPPVTVAPPVVPVKPQEPKPEPDPKPTAIAKIEPKPVPIPLPKPRGMTRKAEALEPLSAVQVSIPGDLQPGDFQPFARISLEIDAQGNATPTLVTSSGNAEIDRRVLDAVKKVRWQPAMQDGQPIPSSFLYRFDFDVQ